MFRVTFDNSNSNNSNICFPFPTLNCPKDKSSFRFLTTTIENHIYTHCANGQPEQDTSVKQGGWAVIQTKI